MRELLGDNEEIKVLRENESTHLVPHFLMLSYLGRMRLREHLENKRAFSMPSASSVNTHLRKLSGMGVLGLPGFALVDKVNSRSPFVAEGRAVGHVAGDAGPTTKLLVMARRAMFLPYRDGLKGQLARLQPGVDSMVRGYLRTLVRWADDWPELARATNEEARAVSGDGSSGLDAAQSLPRAVAKLMSEVRFPDYAVNDVASIIDSGERESSSSTRKAAAGTARVLVDSLTLAVAQRRLDPTLSVLTAYNSIRPHQSKALAQHLRLSAQGLEGTDHELSMYYRLAADILAKNVKVDPTEVRAMCERIGVISQHLGAILQLNQQGGEAE